jgi:hypothetical protein
MKKKFMMLCFAVVGLAGCHPTPPYSAQTSEIVQQVEAAGAGDVAQLQVQELMLFFDTHARLAARLQPLCVAKKQTGDATWVASPEGKVCQANFDRDRVKYLGVLETLKAQELKSGNMAGVENIQKSEGK